MGHSNFPTAFINLQTPQPVETQTKVFLEEMAREHACYGSVEIGMRVIREAQAQNEAARNSPFAELGVRC